jgi:hypothetical protein
VVVPNPGAKRNILQKSFVLKPLRFAFSAAYYLTLQELSWENPWWIAANEL